MNIPETIVDQVKQADRPKPKPLALNEQQLAQLLYQVFNKSLNHILFLYASKHGSATEDYKAFRNESSKAFHRQFLYVFKRLEEKGWLDRCECKGLLRDFPNENCKVCNGIGWINKMEPVPQELAPQEAGIAEA